MPGVNPGRCAAVAADRPIAELLPEAGHRLAVAAAMGEPQSGS